MKYNRFFVVMIVLVIISGLISLLSPILLNYWMADNVGFTLKRVEMLLIILILSLVLQVIFIYLREVFAKEFNKSNFKNMLTKFFKLSYDKINDDGPVNLVERMMQAENNIYMYMTGSSIKIWASVLVMVVVLIMVAIQNIILAGVMLLLVPINYFGFLLINKELSKRSQILQENCASSMQEIISCVGQTDYLKQCSDYENVTEKLSPALDKMYGTMASVNIFAQSTSNVISSVNDIARTMILVFVVYQFIQTSSSPLVLILYTIMLPLYFNNMSVVTNLNLSKRDMNISLELLKEWDNIKEPDGKVDINEIENIEFKLNKLYIKDKIINVDVNDKFNHGDVVWIKGDSGRGKSTLVKLIPKFRTADGIFINGVNIKDISNKSLRSRVVYLSQNVPIVSGTVRDNLFFNKQYSSEIENKLLNEKFMSSIFSSKGMDSIISDNGANLSGGEKQKIAIARMLYDDNDIIILDEVTSNIDKKSAKEILDRVISANKDKIIFIISHDEMPEYYVNKVINL